MNNKHGILIIGAGVGGSAVAAVLAKQGFPVTLLEAQAYAGGCAGTFFHKGYRFDAGATLAAGFYPNGPMDLLARSVGLPAWNYRPSTQPMPVHLPSGNIISRGQDEIAQAERFFGENAIPFFEWQQDTANRVWDLALRLPPLPPTSLSEVYTLLNLVTRWAPTRLRPELLNDLFAKASHHLPKNNTDLRQFVDGQLLISAQALSNQVNALYAAAALDLPRRGVVEPAGGMGAISNTLLNTAQAHGADVHFKRTVIHIKRFRDGFQVFTQQGEVFQARQVVLNLTAPDADRLFLPRGSGVDRVRQMPRSLLNAKGAFVLHVGVERGALPRDIASHQQVIVDEPLAEGNSIFISSSPAWDTSRAPEGHAALTISTHTSIARWSKLSSADKNAYQDEKEKMTERVLNAVEIALPGIRSATRSVLSGTPLTYQRYTGRWMGWVGGFPQTSVLSSRSPRGPHGTWMVGDSIFPGQSVAAVALGALRVSKAIIKDWKKK